MRLLQNCVVGAEVRLEAVLQVKSAYRKLCLLHHPDLCPPSQRLEAEQVFKGITEAYSRVIAGGAAILHLNALASGFLIRICNEAELKN